MMRDIYDRESYYVVSRKDGKARRAVPAAWFMAKDGHQYPKWFRGENGRRYVEVDLYLADSYCVRQQVRRSRLVTETQLEERALSA